MAKGDPVFLAGPTASGKSELALALAENLGGEIISVDAMQVYRGLDIGTAKPSLPERARVPHHLVDICDLNDSFDAAQFLRRSKPLVDAIQAKGRIPIFCGGTGLYFRAYLEGLSPAPPVDAGLRAALRAAPLEELLRELAERDPETYTRIDRQNPRRVIRAVEVIRLTGQPFSQRSSWQPTPRATGNVFGIARSSADLRTRIDARVEEMFQRGLVEETARLLERGLAQNETAMQALGYRQVVEHLRGERSLSQTVELVKIRTRQYARRQMTWFRRQMHVHWIHLQPSESGASAMEAVARLAYNALSPGPIHGSGGLSQ